MIWKTVKVLRILPIVTQIRMNSYQQKSTIYALSSGRGKCGVAVIRISGPESSAVLFKVAGFKKIPQSRKALLRYLKNPESEEVLDQSLVLWFPGPKSFTGEDSCELQVHEGPAVVSGVLEALAIVPGLRPALPGPNSFTGEDSCELQVHGGPAVVSGVLEALGIVPGLRPALPGEFAKRAFYSGKLDLTEVEGLADLVHAETEAQRRQALHQLGGALHRRYDRWRDTLQRNIAHVEAYIDFSEDQHIEESILLAASEELRLLQKEIENHLEDGRRGERTRDGVKTVIVGAPNVGKSSLLNAMCERPAAIVSSTPGTTRDVISSTLDIAGYPVVLSDTAGLRPETSDLVEKEGILRAHQTVGDADLILLVVDSTNYEQWTQERLHSNQPFTDFLYEYVSKLNLEDVVLSCGNIQRMLGLENKKTDLEKVCLIVLNKVDLLIDKSVLDNVCKDYGGSVSAISCKNSSGVDPLLDDLKPCLEAMCSNPAKENACLSQARHRYHLTASLAALSRYSTMCSSESEIDQAAQQLRQALTALGHITGHVSTEQILDVIFKDFCIGK